MTVPVLSIVGSSNSGKTTLVEQLIAVLAGKGLRIASIKHSHHQPEMDMPGKDSWRHKQAGAVTSFLVGPSQMMMVADIEQEINPNLLADRFCDAYDLVLVEGYASLPGAKIEVLRAERSMHLLCHPSELLAVVTNVPSVYPELLQFDLDDIEALSAFVLRWIHHDA